MLAPYGDAEAILFSTDGKYLFISNAALHQEADKLRLDFTVRGTCIQTEIGDSPNSIVVIPIGGSPHKLVLEPEVELIGAADVDIKTLADGSYLLVVPELTALDPTPWDDEITVIWLPANFDSP